ncbi:MAG TPA: oligosaccharide flippase family protein, partial [Hyphomicrobium sp.]|nr:oligosaccharide flippase family protein [Hyphomicrobium sp.]
MKTLISVYGINALAFLSNLAAVFVFLALAGPAGYGSYGVYIVFFAVYYLWDISLIKTTLVVHDDARRQGVPDPTAHAVSFLRGSLLPFVAGSLVLIASGNLIYSVDPATGIGGRIVMLIVAGEHLLSYPVNRVIFHLTLEKRFRTIYTLRLAATLLRHAASWGVLLLTGSVFWAIVAILLKGLVVGAVSLYWIADRFPTVRRSRLRLARGDLAIVLSFFAAAVVVVVMQELPSLFIDRTYGREALGAYRMLYDIVAAVWFLATIYPTILFSSLLAGKAQRTPEETTAFLVRIGDRLALFHLAYFLGVCALILIERSFLWGRLEASYAFGVVAGVSILGYSRFLVEVAQAYGRGRLVLGATLATAA